MSHDIQLHFLLHLLKNNQCPASVFCSPYTDTEFLQPELFQLLFPGDDRISPVVQSILATPPRTILRIHGELECCFFCIRLTETEHPDYLVIGPYRSRECTAEEILQIANRFSLPAKLLPSMEQYLRSIFYIPDDNSLLTLVITFCEELWDGIDSFKVEDSFHTLEAAAILQRPEYKKEEDPVLSMHILEKRYEGENALMQAVSMGQHRKAALAIPSFSENMLEKRISDPVRNRKNYMIILNTLLRKSAEYGQVHPFHIDTVSSSFAVKIEQQTSLEGLKKLQQEMIHKYCLLVQNYSMKDYSLPIRKVMIRIDADLTSDLSLNAMSKELDVNASYLSTLFKKETGVTLTEYVNKKRIDHAILLLNQSMLQIQTIAQYCGFLDVNYFTKLFKKLTGKTPKTYRESIHRNQ